MGIDLIILTLELYWAEGQLKALAASSPGNKPYTRSIECLLALTASLDVLEKRKVFC